MKREALRHPKTYDLACRLKCELPAAIGYLNLLFDFTGASAPQGNIGKWDDEAIARACEWRGEAAHFVQSLCAARILDAHKAHRYLVHDWHEHCEEWVKKRLKRNNLEPFVSVSTAARRRRDNGSLPRPIPNLTKPSLTTNATADAVLPVSLDTDQFKEVWQRWLAHRREKKKPLTPTSEQGLLAKLVGWGEVRAIAAIEHSIANGWQGVFEPDEKNHARNNTSNRVGPGQRFQG